MEINLIHGDAMSLADQVFMFKRTAREAAFRHKMYATFMAKPMAREPGSAMHIHQSVVSLETGRNVFSDESGNPSPLFFSHVAGLQKYLPQAMALFAPNVNSFRRITRHLMAPINTQWGYDNRTAGLRVPISNAESRRIENRLGGADANPYLALAASLACGYLGMVEGLKPSDPITGSAYNLPFGLPRSLEEAVRLLRDCRPLIDVLGERFILAYAAVKESEHHIGHHMVESEPAKWLLVSNYHSKEAANAAVPMVQELIRPMVENHGMTLKPSPRARWSARSKRPADRRSRVTNQFIPRSVNGEPYEQQSQSSQAVL
jgi:glutamine synthetase